MVALESVRGLQEHIHLLANVPRVCNVTLERRQPLNACQVVNWEQRHCVYLPEDMKKFYLSTDGFVLNWSYQYAREYDVF